MIKTRFALLATLAVFTATAMTLPASAVAIKRTNWAGGDPAAAAAPHGSTQPPADTTGARTFDKRHDGAN